ncbi:MAG: ECF transporter S component [Microthrixaceae bacterium]
MSTPTRRRRSSVLDPGPVGAVALVLAGVLGLTMFLWPLVLSPDEGGARSDSPLLFVAILPVVIAVVLAEMARGGIDTKAMAMLGVLTAVGAALRPVGAGIAGIETVFFILVLAGRVYGAGFGFVLGVTTMFASGLLTGGVGPWLPFQMLAAGWAGLGAGLLPLRDGPRRLRGAPRPRCSRPTAPSAPTRTGSCSTCGSGRGP